MRIAIVNDHPEMVGLLRQVIRSLPGRRVVWTAHSGPDAIERAVSDPPDLILMRPVLPGLDGPAVTRGIMRRSPCAILMTPHAPNDPTGKVFEAMGQGALDVVHLSGDPQQTRTALVKKFHTIERLNLTFVDTASPRISLRNVPWLIAIGASTGGPRAVARILSVLPGNLRAAVVVVQHVEKEFSANLVEWLNGHTPLRVALAAEGEMPRPGTVYVAGTDDHLILTPGFTFAYISGPDNLPYHPSADVFFNSILSCSAWNHIRGNRGLMKNIGILLTGMGRDGARGLLALRQAGWHTIAQDEKTSAVYGMPRAARDLEAASVILPLDRIGPALIERLR